MLEKTIQVILWMFVLTCAGFLTSLDDGEMVNLFGYEFTKIQYLFSMMAFLFTIIVSIFAILKKLTPREYNSFWELWEIKKLRHYYKFLRMLGKCPETTYSDYIDMVVDDLCAKNRVVLKTINRNGDTLLRIKENHMVYDFTDTENIKAEEYVYLHFKK